MEERLRDNVRTVTTHASISIISARLATVRRLAHKGGGKKLIMVIMYAVSSNRDKKIMF